MNTIKTKSMHQHCPVCNRYVQRSDKFLSYVCAKCTALATDENGNTILFEKTIGKEGFHIILPETNTKLESKLCLIKGAKFKLMGMLNGKVLLLPQVIRKRTIKVPISELQSS